MFESNNEVIKVWAQEKLTSVKVKKLPNKKRKRETDPEFVVKAVVDVATFDKGTGRQTECISTYMNMDEFYVFIETLKIYGGKALHIGISKANKMPAVELFSKLGGTEWDGSVISRKLSFTSAGPEKKAEFFISADEAPGYKNEKGLYVRNKGVRSTKWISMSLSSAQVIAMAKACQSAVDIMNMWSALGTLWVNLDRIAPPSRADNMPERTFSSVQPRQREGGFTSEQNAGYAAPSQGGFQNQGYAAQGQQTSYAW